MAQPIPMHTVTIFYSFFLLLIMCNTPFECAGGVGSGPVGIECLKVPPSEFVASLRNVGDVLHDVTSTLQFHFSSSNNANSNNNGFADQFLLSDAISVCLDLLDLSADELNWSVSAIESPQGKHNGTGNLSSDLRTWLNAALANTDTCMDGLEGTRGNVVKGLISNGIEKVNSLIHQLLTQVHTTTTVSDHHHLNTTTSKKGQFPSWIEQRILDTNYYNVVDIVVAADGTGNFTKVMDAVNAAPDYSMKRYVVYVKKGVYNENVEIEKKKRNIVMIGEGMDATVISGNLSYVKNNLTAFNTATFGVKGLGFIARDISFRNTAGPLNAQAVALRSDSDLSVFYRCGIFGYQDSLYAHSNRQFYRECNISGTIDFIFGYATAVFQNCTILVKKGSPTQSYTITAHGGKDPTNPSGFSIQFCNISADSDLLESLNSTQSTYLGRPWKPYSRAVFMQCYLSDVLRPEGWLEWNGSTVNLDTLYYAEYENYGPGAGVENRVNWTNYHVMNDSTQASNFTVAQFILGDLWLPSTGVAFTPGFGV